MESANWELVSAKGARGVALSWGGELKNTDEKMNYGASDEYGEHSVNSRKSIQYNTSDFTLNLPLYTGGKLESKQESASLGTEISRMELQNIKQQIGLEATQAYYEVLQCDKIIQVQRDSVNQLQTHLQNVEDQFAMGVVANPDVLRSKTELANAKQNLVNAQSDYDIAILKLNKIVGMPIQSNTNLEDIKEEQYKKVIENGIVELPLGIEYSIGKQKEMQDDAARLLQYAKDNRPDGIAARKNVEQAQQAVGMARADGLPQISIFAGHEDRQDSDSNGYFHDLSAGLHIDWNIFDSNVTKAEVKKAEAAIGKAQAQEKDTMLQIEVDVNSALSKVMAAAKNISSNKIAANQAKEDFVLEQIRYSTGVGTNTDVIDAEVALTTARTNYVESLYKYITAMAELNKAIGAGNIPDNLNGKAVEIIDAADNQAEAEAAAGKAGGGLADMKQADTEAEKSAGSDDKILEQVSTISVQAGSAAAPVSINSKS